MTSGEEAGGSGPVHAGASAEQASGEPAEPKITPGDQWRRVHFISPLVRGWIALVAIIFFFSRDWAEGFLEGGTRGRSPLPEGMDALLAAGILLGVVLLIAGAFFVSWYFTRYQVTAEHVRVHSGVLFRQQRQARLDRVQAIDIVQPFLARIFGLAELKFEVADAGESAVRLAFLRLGQAKQLRATILARAAGVAEDPEHPGDVPEAPEREVVVVPPGRVIGATLLSGTSIALVLAVAAVVALGIGFDTPFIATSFIPIGIGVIIAYWSALNTGYNFRAATSPDGIRMRYGLLDTRAQTVPPGRVQALGIVQPPLWRLKGWYRVTVNVAGYGISASTEGQARATLLPVGTRDEVLQILALVLPDPGTPRPVEVFFAGMDGRGDPEGFTTTPRRARWLAPFAWRRNGFAVTGTALLVRSGVLWRQLVVVPHERTQSLSLHQGPLDRRLRVAELQVQTTPGPVSPRVPLADAGVAWELFHGQASRAADARRRSGPEQWMKPVPVAGSEHLDEPRDATGPDVDSAASRHGATAGPASAGPIPGEAPPAPSREDTATTPAASDEAPSVPAHSDRSGPAEQPHRAEGAARQGPQDAGPSDQPDQPAGTPAAPADREVMPEVPRYEPAGSSPSQEQPRDQS